MEEAKPSGLPVTPVTAAEATPAIKAVAEAAIPEYLIAKEIFEKSVNSWIWKESKRRNAARADSRPTYTVQIRVPYPHPELSAYVECHSMQG